MRDRPTPARRRLRYRLSAGCGGSGLFRPPAPLPGRQGSQFLIPSRVSGGQPPVGMRMGHQLLPFEQARRWTVDFAARSARALALDRPVPYLARVGLLAAVYFSAAKL